ncbi:MAG: hypothetical protein ACNI27_03210 [Desulfovibrio sp.]
MIVCTKCGAANEDQQHSCKECGLKLQSGRQVQAHGQKKKLLQPPDYVGEERSGAGESIFREAARTWIIILVTLIALGTGASLNLWWPVVAITVLLGLGLWGRMV